MKRYLILIFLLAYISSFGNKNDSLIARKTKFFKKESQFFADSMISYYRDNSKHLVFVANFISSNDKKDKYCFTLGYILNESEITSVPSTHYCLYNGFYILINIKQTENKRFIERNQFKKISKIDSLKIKGILYPEEKGGFTYTGKGLVFCNDKDNYKSTFYSNSDEIPFQYSIFAPFQSQVKIKKIK